MGKYFCEKCKFFEDDTDKGHFHCDDCGICRIGSRENFFHCKKCGKHFIYLTRCTVSCYSEMIKRDNYCCPICSKSIIDMSKTWKRIDEEIEETIKVWILCNDCNDTTEVYFHIIGQKCRAATANRTTRS